MTTRAYLDALARVPAGETRSFAELAQLAGRPGAARAAGRAVAGCPIESALPWQRAVGSRGALAADPARRAEQLRRLRAEGARPRAGEPLRAWVLRRSLACVGSWRSKELHELGEGRIGELDPTQVEGFVERAAAIARGFLPPGVAPADLVPGPAGLGTRARDERAPFPPLEARLDALARSGLARELATRGVHRARAFLAPSECRALLAAAGAPERFERSVLMARHGFGTGAYHYWREPLPEPALSLRRELYALLAPLAAEHETRLGRARPPRTLAELWRRCRAAGQARPSSILLCYGAGGVNHPHRDLYGEVAFPYQALVVLGRRGLDFEGGEFRWIEEGARERRFAASLGDLIVFATRERLAPDGAPTRSIPVRHGATAVRAGIRAAIGIVFHLAR